MPPRRLVCHLTVCIIFAQSWSIVAVAGVHGTGTRQELLLKLKKCRADLRKTPREKKFDSRCARLDLRPLSGINIAQLETVLGRRDISSDEYVLVPNNPSEPQPPYECRWAFYKISPTPGGGPELECISKDRVRCVQVQWVMTQ